MGRHRWGLKLRPCLHTYVLNGFKFSMLHRLKSASQANINKIKIMEKEKNKKH
jgi:hypothetical protein